MRIYWTPIKKTRAMALKILELKETSNITYEKLAKIFGHDRTYIIALRRWALENKDKFLPDGAEK